MVVLLFVLNVRSELAGITVRVSESAYCHALLSIHCELHKVLNVKENKTFFCPWNLVYRCLRDDPRCANSNHFVALHACQPTMGHLLRGVMDSEVLAKLIGHYSELTTTDKMGESLAASL